MQEDTASTIRDLREAGYDLVIFIDDLDRCTADTTAEIFEAINLFLSGTTELEAKFVIGLDRLSLPLISTLPTKAPATLTWFSTEMIRALDGSFCVRLSSSLSERHA